MKRIVAIAAWLGLALALSAAPASAQNCSGQPAANTVCAGPTSGGGGLPSFRALVPADYTGLLSTNNTWTGTNIFSPVSGTAITVNPPAASLNLGIKINQTVAGAVASGVGAWNWINITADNADCTLADTDGCFGLYIAHTTGGAATKGSRSTIFTHMIVNADAAASAPNRDYIGINSLVSSNAAMPVTATPASLFAFAGGVSADAGSSGLNALVGAEIDVSPNVTGIPYVIGWNVSYNGNQAASTRSVGYELSALTGSPGWGYGIGFTTQSGAAPLANTGTVMAALEAISLAKGIDFTNFTFSGNAWTSTGASITSAGAINATQTVTITGTTTDGFSVTDSTVTGVLATSALHTHSLVIGPSTNHALVFIANNGEVGSVTETATTAPWVLGVPSTRIGTLGLAGNTSGTATITPQAAAGTPTLTIGTTSGTIAASATSPLAISATTGVITCTTCATTTNGGALSGTAPVAISAAGAISITGAAGQVLAGSGPAFTATPTLGVASTTTGTLTFATSGGAGTGALQYTSSASSATLTLPATTTTLAGLAVAETFTAVQTIAPTIAANTTADGLVLSDTTTASSGNQQYSPRIRLTGAGWKTDSTAASQLVDWIIENRTVQGAANPSSQLTFSNQTNAGGYTARIGILDDPNGGGNLNVKFTESSSVQFALFVGATQVGTFYSDAGQAIVGAQANVPLVLITNGTAKITVAAAGAVTLASTLTVSGIGADTAHTDSTVCQDTTTHLFLSGTGALGVCLGTSGRQFKRDFAPMQAGLAEISALKLWNYYYRDGYGDSGANMQYGPTAQDVQEVLPDLVRTDAKGDVINYDWGSLIPIALHAIQQLKAANDNLRGEIEKMRGIRR